MSDRAAPPLHAAPVSPGEPKGGALKVALIVLGILVGIGIAGGGIYALQAKKQAVAEEQARATRAAEQQAELEAQQRAQEQAAKEIADRAAAEQAAAAAQAAAEAPAAPAVAPGEDIPAAPGNDAADASEIAKQKAKLDAAAELEANNKAAIQDTLNNARACLSMRDYTCAIRNVDVVLGFDPSNKIAKALKKTAEDAQNKATQDISID